MVYDPNFEFGNFKNYIEKWRGHFSAYNKETSFDNEKNQKVYEKYRQVRDLRLSLSLCSLWLVLYLERYYDVLYFVEVMCYAI